MPFSETTKERTKEYWTDHFENFLKPIIEENPEFQAFRSEPIRGDMIDEIIKQLAFCPIVIADLTDLNANVFWELGVRQSFKHGTITIAEKDTTLPFDIFSKGTLFYYPKNHIKNQKFITKLKKAIADCKTNPRKSDSHVLDVISGRGTLFEMFKKDEAKRRVDALIIESIANISLNKHIYQKITENKKNPKERKWVTAKFRTLALELLLTNRYLDENENFYIGALNAFSALQMKNSAIEQGFDNPDKTEDWFLRPELKDKFSTDVTKFMEALHRVRKKLRY